MGDVRLNAEFTDYDPTKRLNDQVTTVNDLLNDFVVRDEMVKEMIDAEIIWSNTIVRGHVQVWAAPANGGKTTLAMHAAKELAHDGFDVFYFLEDAGGSDLKQLVDTATSGGYRLLNSTVTGKSVGDILKTIGEIAGSQADLSNNVYIFDTLKKFCDLMGKGASRAFFSLMRSLSTLGGTVILLGHTNKNPDHRGKPIFEGVGDVRNDVDELFYLSKSAPDENGNSLIGIEPDKVRAVLQATTYKLTANREVIPIETERSVAQIRKLEQSREEHEPVITYITSYLDEHESEKLTSLAEKARDNCGIGLNKARSIIMEHSGSNDDKWVLWRRTRVKANNTIRISKKCQVQTENQTSSSCSGFEHGGS